jgi:hypothetical protein
MRSEEHAPDARRHARQRLRALWRRCAVLDTSLVPNAPMMVGRRLLDSTHGSPVFTGTVWTEKVLCPPSARTRSVPPASISSRRPYSRCVHIVGETTWQRRNESVLSCKSFGLPSRGASRVERNQSRRGMLPQTADGAVRSHPRALAVIRVECRACHWARARLVYTKIPTQSLYCPTVSTCGTNPRPFPGAAHAPIQRLLPERNNLRHLKMSMAPPSPRTRTTNRR